MTEAPRVHPHIVATGGKPDSVTHYLCPASPAGEVTHHLVPRGAGSTRLTGQTYVATCVYCRQTEGQLRKELGL